MGFVLTPWAPEKGSCNTRMVLACIVTINADIQVKVVSKNQ
jgi:hypothetical protein